MSEATHETQGGTARAEGLAAEAALTARLKALDIPFRRHAHPPLHTVEESRALRGEMPGAHCKNLFLKERKGGFWLVTCLEDRRLRIGDLSRQLGIRRLGFAGADDLRRLLGVRPGAVTPLALMNDPAGEVGFVLDRAILSADVLNCHPLHNEATVALAVPDLMRFFADTGHIPREADFDALEALAAAAG